MGVNEKRAIVGLGDQKDRPCNFQYGVETVGHDNGITDHYKIRVDFDIFLC